MAYSRTRALRSLLLAAGTTSLAWSFPLRAQQAPAADETSGDIIVTAQKRTQNLTDVGINIAVVGQAELARRRVEQITDLVAFTPNVSIKENIPGLVPVITIRGVGLNDFSATNNPSAGIYVDEVSLSSLALANFDFFDIERLEALKGPQGTLYGRNSTAGAINVISARPNFDGISGRIAASYGNYQSFDIDGALNLPVNDTIALRFAVKGINQAKGWYYNERLKRDIGRRDIFLGRAQARIRSGPLDIILKVEGQRGRSELGSPEFFGALQPVPPVAGLVCPGSQGCTDFFGYRDTDGDPFRGNWSIDPRYTIDQVNTSARINADLGFATLTSVTGYIDFKRSWGVDVDAGPLPQTDFVTRDKVRQFSQELRLAGETPIVDWLVGGFYSRDRVDTTYDGNLNALFNTTTFTFANQLTKTAAAFANGEWKLTDTLRLITGIRYTDERRSNVGGTRDLVSRAPGSALTNAPFGTPPISLASVNASISDQNWSWKLGLNYKPSSRTLIYASAAQGVKSGGFFAGVATSSAQLLPYRPERLVAYEVGVKTRIPDVGLSLAASGFYYDYNDVQTFIRDTIGGLPVQRLGNVDKAKIYGTDVDLVLSPPSLRGLTVNAGVGLLHTRLGAFVSGNGPVAAGNRLSDAPSLSLTGGVAYEFALTGDINARLQINSRYQSRTFKDALNDPLIASRPFAVVDARATVLRESDWEVAIWGKNIGDKRYVTQGLNQLALGSGNRVYGAPRTYGVSVSKSFR